MKNELDRNSPVPLYHQIAEAIRYGIATGRIPAGEKLASVRDAAEKWCVNLHTVRRAYTDLANEGLIESLGPLGTRVLGQAVADNSHSSIADAFIARVVREAREIHGLRQAELAERVMNWTGRTERLPDKVFFVECSESQCLGHTRELESQWNIEALPWSLSSNRELPSGPIISTYFHYNDIRRRWPKRLHEVRFVAIHPDPSLPNLFEKKNKKRNRITLCLCEFDRAKLLNISADLSLLLPPDRYRIVPKVVKRAGELLRKRQRRGWILFAPRVWGALSAEEKANPNVAEVRYVLTAEDLNEVGRYFGWKPRRY